MDEGKQEDSFCRLIFLSLRCLLHLYSAAEVYSRLAARIRRMRPDNIDNIENIGDWELMLSMLYTEAFSSIKKCLST